MTVEDFGEVQALISILLQIGALLTIIGYITINLISNNKDKQTLSVILELEKLAYFLAAIIALILIGSSFYLKEALNFNSILPLATLPIILGLSVPLVVRNSYLQAQHKFRDVSVSGVFISSGRLFFAIILVSFGLRSFGAIAGIFLAYLAALFYVSAKTKGVLPLLNIPTSLKTMKSIIKTKIIRRELKYGVTIFIALFSITLLYTADVIIVRKYFSATEAGLYSGIATIARIIFFATGSIAGVLLPSIKIKSESNENKRVLIKSLILISALGGSILFAFIFMSEFITKMMIGPKYASHAVLLPWLGISIFLTSILNLITMYYIALRKNFIGIAVLFGVISSLLLSFVNHANLISIINNFIIGNILAFVIIASIRLIQKKVYSA